MYLSSHALTYRADDERSEAVRSASILTQGRLMTDGEPEEAVIQHHDITVSIPCGFKVPDYIKEHFLEAIAKVNSDIRESLFVNPAHLSIPMNSRCSQPTRWKPSDLHSGPPRFTIEDDFS